MGYYDTEKNELFEFLTNNFEITAYEIANLYKNRCQIEVFFKWIKQNLTIKHLWGHSENAVKTHILDSNYKLSTYSLYKENA
ncbi:transposase [Capnocytophaga gingivalis]|uniref:transposase n=1 Tax=Capnocytophaga gingivalis TaxID=1017 RepID=UPI0036F2AA85